MYECRKRFSVISYKMKTIFMKTNKILKLYIFLLMFVLYIQYIHISSVVVV